ncbi:MAG TPA: class I SAM-dependent methyltransferase [Pirellulaceae bacterium]|nr:class I SAM-dependent methyltransferase [Pirellulaceae bacterium]
MSADRCPICDSRDFVSTVRRRGIPAMQNYVFKTREAAREAKRGDLDLRVCVGCGFGWNGAFDPALLDYDLGYDNSVPSRVMDAYYDSLADELCETYALSNRLAIDVGCGKGTFLRRLCRRRPDVRGLGVDPSFEAEAGDEALNIQWIVDLFRPEQVTEPPALVLCRHVIEHIPRPVGFLASIREGVARYPGTPGFFEAPDLGWIVQQEAFWDFCFEHCNYFSPGSLSVALSRAGFEVDRVATGFGEQYLHAFVRSRAEQGSRGTSGASSDVAAFVQRVASYAEREAARQREVATLLGEAKADGRRIVLWGMATKGILFANLVDAQATLIDACVDVNERKQGAFVPVTGHQIQSPQALREGVSLRGSRSDQPLVIVMNPNYAGEIAETLRSLDLDAMLIDAHGAPLQVAAAA